MERRGYWVLVLYTVAVLCAGFQLFSPFLVHLQDGDHDLYFGFYAQCTLVNATIDHCFLEIGHTPLLNFEITIRILFSITFLLKFTILLVLITLVVVFLDAAERKMCIYKVPFLLIASVTDTITYIFYSAHNRHVLHYSAAGFYAGLCALALTLLTAALLTVRTAPTLLRQWRADKKMRYYNKDLHLLSRRRR